LPLRIAAKVDRVDQEYFTREIEPLLEPPLVELVGEIGDDRKGEFLGRAAALLFPIDWPEPFGLTMIEAMACGTPVIAFRRGSVPEVMIEGQSGWIVDSIDEACRALERLRRHERERCRRAFEERYTVQRMARDYVAVYEAVLARRHHPASGRGPRRSA
jgi:glycosyltransferase involved in cell wall biosynthesis